jgi:hypothetical protein
MALGNFLALCRIALEHCPALAKNCIALAKSTKVWSPAAFIKETIYQKIVHR